MAEVAFYSAPTEVAEEELEAVVLNKRLLVDRIEQIMAELQFAKIDDAFPIAVTFKDVQNEVSAAIDKYLERVQRCSNVGKTLDAYLERFRMNKPLPSLYYAVDRIKILPTSTLDNLKVVSLNRSRLGEGIQGVTYLTSTIVPLQDICKEEVVSATILDHYGLTSGVAVVMKRADIIDTALWRMYNDLHGKVLEWQDFYALHSDVLHRYLRLDMAAFREMVERENGYDDLVEMTIQLIADLYNNPANPAYVDAKGAYLGSELVSNYLSPFHPLMYGSARVNDERYSINGLSFPVQLTFVQLLDGTVNDLFEVEYFGKHGEDFARLLSMFAQVTFGLHIAQSVFGLVHRDPHTNNVMYETVDQSHYLYYCYALQDGTYRYYAIPTFGKVYKLIDYGYAYYEFAEKGARTPGIDWKADTLQGDMIKFTGYVLQQLWLTSEYLRKRKKHPLFDLARKIATCTFREGKHKGKKVDLFELARGQCQQEQSIQESLDCYLRHVSTYAYYADLYECSGAIPAALLGEFDRYIVSRQEIPTEAIIYPMMSAEQTKK